MSKKNSFSRLQITMTGFLACRARRAASTACSEADLPPYPPPTNGAMIRTFSVGRPNAWATRSWTPKGVWVEAQTLALSFPQPPGRCGSPLGHGPLTCSNRFPRRLQLRVLHPFSDLRPPTQWLAAGPVEANGRKSTGRQCPRRAGQKLALIRARAFSAPSKRECKTAIRSPSRTIWTSFIFSVAEVSTRVFTKTVFE